MKIWVVVGTRPEVIKQIPVYWSCCERYGKENVKLIGTGQHRELLAQALAHFGAELDANFEIMRPGQSLSKVAASVLERFDDALEKERPDWVIVQGDTSTAAMAAIAAFHRQIKVAHNEAGLRSYDLQNPFPEEANRKIISAIADCHFAPTRIAKEALARENLDPTKIFVVGNTGIDSLFWTLAQPRSAKMTEFLDSVAARGAEPVLLTAHRRENAGSTMEQWFDALKNFFVAHPELHLVYPVHPNNLARPHAEKFLAPLKNVWLCDPLSYLDTCHLLKACRLVVTDSGGIQEESATLGVPAVVCRKTTERPEGVLAGRAKLIKSDQVHREISKALDWALAVSRTSIQNLFGDGKAAHKIASLLGNVPRDFEVVILAGGLGTRLQSVVPTLPKALAPIAGRAFMAYLLDYVSAWNPKKIHVSVGYKKEEMQDFLSAASARWPVNIVSESEPLGTGGAVRNCLPHLKSGTVIVLNGDTFFAGNFEQMLSEFHSDRADFMVASTTVPDCSRYGQIKFNAQTKVLLEFREKAPGSHEHINTGVYVFDVASLQKNLPQGNSSLEKDFLEKRQSLGLKAKVYTEDAYFLDIGVPEDFERAQSEVKNWLLPAGLDRLDNAH